MIYRAKYLRYTDTWKDLIKEYIFEKEESKKKLKPQI